MTENKEKKRMIIRERMTDAFNLTYIAYKNSMVYRDVLPAEKIVPVVSKIYDELKELDDEGKGQQ